MAGDALPWRKDGDGVTLFVRAQPKARADRIAGIVEDADGGVRLKIQVTAAPEDGKANAAIVKLLAKTLKLPKSAVELTAGAASRSKTLRIGGVDAETLAAAFGPGRSAKGK